MRKLKLIFHKRFEKQFTDLSTTQKNKVKSALRAYLQGDDDRSLRIHQLTGEFKGQISISAGGDLRIHMIIDDAASSLIVLQVGSHSQLYR
jgi:addiction module RelE/StbE family toxin